MPFNTLWEHELKVPVFGSLSLCPSSGNGVCMVHLYISLRSNFVFFIINHFINHPSGLFSLFCGCSYLLFSGREHCCIGFLWLHHLEGRHFLNCGVYDFFFFIILVWFSSITLCVLWFIHFLSNTRTSWFAPNSDQHTFTWSIQGAAVATPNSLYIIM